MLTIPVFVTGDCIDPAQIFQRMNVKVSGVLVGCGVLRRPWILSQTADLAVGRTPAPVTPEDRGRFLLAFIDLLLKNERTRSAALQAYRSWLGERGAKAGLLGYA